MPDYLDSVEACVEQTIARVGPDLVIGAPLGLGKPVQLMNAFYQRAASDPDITLHFITALSLEVPKPASELEASLAGPIMERLFGDYEELAFLAPYKADTLPPNIKVTELYFKAGSMKNNASAQQNYISSNYTHIARDMLGLGINVLVQMVAAREEAGKLSLSLSCNPDVALEIIDRVAAQAEAGGDEPALVAIAQTHADLPFMELDAQVSTDVYDMVVTNPDYDKQLFAVPNAAVPVTDYAVAMHASQLIVDGGTLQIGIGSLGDAVAQACVVRHKDNATYRRIVEELSGPSVAVEGGMGPFEQGLYVSTEMFVNGMMHLIEQGIVKRRVYDDLTLQQGINAGRIDPVLDDRFLAFARESDWLPRCLDDTALAKLQYWGVIGDDAVLEGETLTVAGQACANDLDDAETRAVLNGYITGRSLRNGRILHGGFFLGPRDFYQKLQQLDEQGQQSICMTGVRRTNQLLLDYPLYSAQRQNARFINTGMMVSLNGSVASDALQDGTVISGVGGQYNFVAMAHDLPGARSVLCIRSTRGHGKDAASNIVPSYGYTTIPKHLRDIVITEYGVADLRGQSDSEVIKRLINIADSRFQDELLDHAREHGKVARDYEIPAAARRNTAERVVQTLRPYQQQGVLPDYPFGSELTEQELALAGSLRKIKALSDEPVHFVARAFRALLHKEDPEAARPFLERLHLEHPETPRDFLVQQLLLLDLEERGLLKAG